MPNEPLPNTHTTVGDDDGGDDDGVESDGDILHCTGRRYLTALSNRNEKAKTKGPPPNLEGRVRVTG